MCMMIDRKVEIVHHKLDASSFQTMYNWTDDTLNLTDGSLASQTSTNTNRGVLRLTLGINNYKLGLKMLKIISMTFLDVIHLWTSQQFIYELMIEK